MTLQRFKVGEIAIVDPNSTANKALCKYLGSEVIVECGPYVESGFTWYDVRHADGTQWMSRALLKKPPAYDGRQIVQWQHCPWQPSLSTLASRTFTLPIIGARITLD